MSITSVLEEYAKNDSVELEYRIKKLHVKDFKRFLISVLEKKSSRISIEQSINFIAPSIDNNTRICKLFFVNGQKKNKVFYEKKQIAKVMIRDTALTYLLSTSIENSISPFQVSLSKMARVKLRISLKLDNPILNDWRFDFTLVKTVYDLISQIKAHKNNMLFEISPSTFVEKAPWDYADSFELEVEHCATESSKINNKKMTEDHIKKVAHEILTVFDPDYESAFLYQTKLKKIMEYFSVGKKQFYSNENNTRKTMSLRKIRNRPKELNRANYYKEIFVNMTKYYVADKTDGVGAYVLIEGRNMHVLNGKMITKRLPEHHDHDTLIDAELVKLPKAKSESKSNNENEQSFVLYVFDVMVFNGEALHREPFDVRIKYIDRAAAMLGKYGKTKSIVRLTDNYKKEITEIIEKKTPYETDGLIFTPSFGSYRKMQVWKWKPLTHMSIDFLVKEPVQSLIGKKPYMKKPGHKLFFLMCGINKQLFDKLRLATVQGYTKMFPHQNMYKYFPVQFSPSDEPYAYMYYHPENNKFSIKDITNMVCEFRWDVDTSTWHLMRTRSDRTREIKQGTYFGNDFYVAEYTWQNYQNPLTFQDLIISSTEFMNSRVMGYFQEKKSNVYVPIVGFHSFVKGQLIARFRGAKWLVDLAGGQGADMFRISKAGIKNALFIDSDKQAVSELTTRKYSFQRNVKKLNTRIFTKVADLTDDWKKIINSVQRIGIPIGDIDVVLCNFAIHYIATTSQNLRNFVQIVRNLLKPGGYFIFTCFNGEKIFELLKEKNEWNIRDGEVLKYSIKKKYTSSNFELFGQKVDVILPFSRGQYYEESLINISNIISVFKTNKFTCEKRSSFDNLLAEYKRVNPVQFHKITEHDKQYTGLHDFVVLRKHSESTRAQKSKAMRDTRDDANRVIAQFDTKSYETDSN